MPSHHQKHNGADHDYIVARQNRYIEAYRASDANALVKFMDDDDFVYSDHGAQRENLQRHEMHGLFQHTFKNFYDLKIETISLHGTKKFTAWEWEITCKPALNADGERKPVEDCQPAKLKGCTLMWWNNKDKIIRNHDYVQQREP